MDEHKSPCTDRGALTPQLLELVSKRTGYPTEMLDLDLSMEADLGIDSIKRVEILSGLVSSGKSNWSNGQVEMEKLTSFKRLREIIDYLLSAAEKNGKGQQETPPAAEPSASPAAAASKTESRLSAAHRTRGFSGCSLSRWPLPRRRGSRSARCPVRC